MQAIKDAGDAMSVCLSCGNQRDSCDLCGGDLEDAHMYSEIAARKDNAEAYAQLGDRHREVVAQWAKDNRESAERQDKLLTEIRELRAMLAAIDMRDLAPTPLTAFGGERWTHAHYCCEGPHEHPTVPQFLEELKHRVKEG